MDHYQPQMTTSAQFKLRVVSRYLSVRQKQARQENMLFAVEVELKSLKKNCEKAQKEIYNLYRKLMLHRQLETISEAGGEAEQETNVTRARFEKVKKDYQAILRRQVKMNELKVKLDKKMNEIIASLKEATKALEIAQAFFPDMPNFQENGDLNFYVPQ